MLEIECNRQLKSIQRSQATRATVLPDQPFRRDPMVLGKAVNLNIARRNIKYEPRSLNSRPLRSRTPERTFIANEDWISRKPRLEIRVFRSGSAKIAATAWVPSSS
jgi:hypothetical protein